jgi:cell filamentation protein
MDEREQEILEGRLVYARLLQVRARPAPDRFDVVYLKELHRFIFQDFPKYGIENPPPGEFRLPVKSGGDWHKVRSLTGMPNVSVVCYSPMDKGALSSLNKTLKGINPGILSQLKPSAFADAMSELYARLDYIHPFHEGNSRTLREFTWQLAQASRHELDWARFDRNDNTRNLLYIARDRAVGTLAVPNIRHHDNLRSVVYCMDLYAQNPGLAELLRSAVRPSRAKAFEQLPELDAVEAYPELREAFKALHAASEYFEAKLAEESLRCEALTQVRQHIQMQLDVGETVGFVETDGRILGR